jgi:hypothetical protein
VTRPSDLQLGLFQIGAAAPGALTLIESALPRVEEARRRAALRVVQPAPVRSSTNGAGR